MLALEWAPLSSSGLLLYQQVHYPTSEHSLYPAEGGLTAFWIHHRTPGDPSTPDTATEITRGWKKPVSGQGPSLKPEGAKNSPCSPKTTQPKAPQSQFVGESAALHKNWVIRHPQGKHGIPDPSHVLASWLAKIQLEQRWVVSRAHKGENTVRI